MVPDESPEVSHGVREGTLCCNVLIATIVTLRIWRENVCGDVVCVEGGVCEGRCVWREMCGCVKVVCVVVRT